MQTHDQSQLDLQTIILRSKDGLSGFILGIMAVVFAFGALFLGAYFTGILFIIPIICGMIAICFAIFGLIMSITAATSGSKDDRRSKVLSIVGIVLNGLVALAVIVGILAVFVFLANGLFGV